MNVVREDALSLLTEKEPEEGKFVDWMLCVIFSFLFLVCCEFRCVKWKMRIDPAGRRGAVGNGSMRASNWLHM